MTRRRLSLTIGALLLAVLTIVAPLSSAAVAATVGDGPAPCTTGTPPSGLHGECATYNQLNTWYGTYGPGFPTPLGWGLCAWAPATGGWYPSPSYGYVLADPPTGADTSNLWALGFSFSEGAVNGYWQGSLIWSADDAAVAAKLYFDALAWHVPLPSMSPGVNAAVTFLYDMTLSTLLASGTPQLTISLPGGATSFTTHTTATALLAYPITGAPFAHARITFHLTGATFDATRSDALVATTAADGTVTLPLTATSATASTVALSATLQLGSTGMLYERPSQPAAQNAQEIAAPLAPSALERTETWASLAPPPALGRIAVDKAGNDQPYLSVAGATFEVRSGSTVVDTLIVDESGHAGPSSKLPVGTYTLHESLPPPGYLPAADQQVTVTADATTTVDLLGAQADQVIVASVSLVKVNDLTSAPLAGAVLDLAYDATHAGTYVDIGSCTTDVTGRCVPPGGDALLPGYYRATELSAPPGFLVNPTTAVQFVELAPGQAATVTFADDRILTTLSLAKSNAAEPDQGVPGATYDLYVQGTPPAAAPPTGPLLASVHDSLTWFDSGTTDASGHLTFTIPVGFSWCVQERSSPPEFILDPALRCTAVITEASPDPVRTVAVSEQVAAVELTALKFNVAAPGVVIPDATYALFVQGTFPPGFTSPPVPGWLVQPAGSSLWGIATTDHTGHLAFSVPSGHSWCLEELRVPSGYLLDDGLHCTGVLTSSATPAVAVALPELAATGLDAAPLSMLGAVLVTVGTLCVSIARRRRIRS